MSLVTTVIPAFNAQDFLKPTLECLAAQTRRPDRVILLDDRSTDGTADVARAFSGIQVEHVLNPRNLGLFPNHTRALEFAEETDYLHILHANDLVRPEFYEELLGCFDDRPGAAMAFSQYEFVDESGAPAGSPGPVKFHRPREVSRHDFLVRQSELNPILIDAVLHRTNRQPSPCLFPLDYPHLGDVVFHANWAAEATGIFESPKPLCRFRRHASSTTNANTRKLQAWVIDEWRAINHISAMIEEGGFARWVRARKLRCLFAARTVVKAGTFRHQPEYAGEITREGRHQVGSLYWTLGRLAVQLRNALSRQR